MAGIDLAALRARVDAAVADQLRRGAADLADLSPEADDLLAPIGALLSGGKRFRPVMLYVGYRAAGRPDAAGVIRLAATMEFLHAAALIHDDVIDSSDTRRGMPTVHCALRERHRERGWDGDPQGFGVAAAILAGNLCLGWADQAYDECGLPQSELARGRATLDRMRTQLMAGQYLDVVGAVRPWSTMSALDRIAAAERVITFKSAKYSIQHPLLLGARVGGVSAAADAALTAYGLELGIAFQLRDDLLGVFGDPQVTGKPAGDDLREGKRTVLIAHTLAARSAADRTWLESRLGDPDLDGVAIERLRGLIARSGAVAAVEREIARRGHVAADAISSAHLEPIARETLRDFIATATARDA